MLAVGTYVDISCEHRGVMFANLALTITVLSLFIKSYKRINASN